MHHHWIDRVHLAATVVMAIVFTVVLVGHTADDGIVLGHDLAPISSPRLVHAEAIARTIFGDVCHGQVAVTVAPLSGGAAGLASWTPADDGTFTNCTVIIGSGRQWSFPMLCAIVVHEYGHLAGMPHSTQPKSVMFGRLSTGNVPRRCQVRAPIG